MGVQKAPKMGGLQDMRFVAYCSKPTSSQCLHTQGEETAVEKLESKIKELHIFRIEMGQDLLVTLQRVVQETGIRQGVILSGIGSLVTYHVHVVGAKRRPVPNIYMHGSGSYDLLAMQGYIFDGRVHAHVTLSNPVEAIGGHLEPGCEVYTFAIIAIAELEGPPLGNLDEVRWPD
jgi:predicted DNA-binding protein with PD1-like motif